MSHDCIAHFRVSDGKAQTLSDHLQAVGAKAAEFAGRLRLGNAGELVGLLHDLGKYSNEFQTYLRSAVGLIDPDADDYVDFAGLKVHRSLIVDASGSFVVNDLPGLEPEVIDGF